MKYIALILTLFVALSSHAQSNEDAVTIAQTHWQKHKVARGVKAMHAQVANLYGGPQDIYLVEVNLRRRHYLVGNHNGRGLTTSHAASQGALAAINGTYFDMGAIGRSVCLVAQDGKIVDYTNGTLGALSNAILTTSRSGRIRPWNPLQDERVAYPDSIASSKQWACDAMVSGPLLVLDGTVPEFRDESHLMSKHPRSAMGFRGHKAYLIVIDGRAQGRAIGVTIPELAHLMQSLGMTSAINLDGGGSSVLWVRPTRRTLPFGNPDTGILNRPSDGKERAVSNSVFVK